MDDAGLNKALTTASVSENEKATIRQILAERASGTRATPCKIPIPSFVETEESPVKITTAPDLKMRGPLDQWSFCFKRVNTATAAVDEARNTNVPAFTPSMDGSYDLLGDGQSYMRVAVTSFNKDDVRTTACKYEVKTPIPQELPLLLVFDVDPNTMNITGVRGLQRDSNGNITAYGNSNALFAKLFLIEKYPTTTIASPVPTHVTVYRFSLSACGNTTMSQGYPALIDLFKMGLRAKSFPGSVNVASWIQEVTGKSLAGTAINVTHTSNIGDGKIFVAMDVGLGVPYVPSQERIVIQESVINTAQLGNKPSINIATIPVFSVSLWVRVLFPCTQWRNVFLFGRSDGDRTPGMWIFPDSTNRITFRMQRGDAGWNDGIDIANPVGTGTWFHFAAIVNGNQLSVYINGTQVPGSLAYSSSEPFTWVRTADDDGSKKQMSLLGNITPRWIDPAMPNSIEIQRFYWYNKVLTVAEIAGLAAAAPTMQTMGYQCIAGERTIPVPKGINFGAPPVYTVAMWINAVQGQGWWRNVLFHGAQDDWTGWVNCGATLNGIDRTPGVWIYPDWTARVHFRHRNNDRNNCYRQNEGLDVYNNSSQLGRWFHYASVVNNNTITLYMNGQQVQSATWPASFDWNNVRTKMFRFMWGLNESHGLVIQKVHWFNEALDATRIRALTADNWMQAQLGPYMWNSIWRWDSRGFPDSSARVIWNTPNMQSVAPTGPWVTFKRSYWADTTIPARIYYAVDDYSYVIIQAVNENGNIVKQIQRTHPYWGAWWVVDAYDFDLLPGYNIVNVFGYNGGGAAGCVFSVYDRRNWTVLVRSDEYTITNVV
jgi:hypothetical protein